MDLLMTTNSIRIQHNLANHQRPRARDLLPLLRDVQVPLPVRVRPARRDGHGRAVLPARDTAYVRRALCGADLSRGAVLLGA